MSRTISRKAKGARRQARSQGTKRQMRKAQATTNSFIDALMRVLPFTEEQLQRAFLVLILVGLLALAWVIASVSGLTVLVEQQAAKSAAEAGFQVRRVEVRGVERMNELKVYERVLSQRDQSMMLVDLADLRQELLTLPWVQDARVSRQLPDAVVVDIVERTPHAVLKKPRRLMLIDGTGHELEPISPEKAEGMLIISGPGAAKKVGDLTKLLDAAPALKPQVARAEWVGNRRWNLTFKTDQILALPEGEQKAAGALVSFAKLDGVNRLLGGDVTRFDMRTGDRLYMRVPGREKAQSLAASKDT
ncbi:cell division protein FtsQ/DivIB [Altericroceibacterium endophyticum]|uniref:Cell division protein FtsQ n=1 Tax=Altericroceibacterium endophyticum TaxID=1808508 RepID=A0A6I4T872_9SPHN|nr:FtsQ-type POTRA domain-containing protein [Altericroceibacterium endophyticum]MXO66452.1 FtsQ-type POTRA domain-containing protein [Altericroceibacterium endophyticum]